MNPNNPKFRPAMTAIAAAIALSTPSFAQEAEVPAAETATPVVETPVVAEPVVTDTPPAADTLAPAEAVATPAARRATTTRTPAERPRPAPARAAPAAPAPAAAETPAAVAVAPVVDAPVVEPLPIEPEAAPVAAPIETAEPGAMDGMMMPLAAGGLALLALAAAALVLRRRRRHAAEAEDLAMRDSELAAIDEPEPRSDPVKPAFVAALATAAAPMVAAPSTATNAPPAVAAASAADSNPDEDVPVTELPEDFDLSRFGYNVQEAYKGPTEDNASLSLKNRLTRARGMDQLERNLDAEVEAATGEAVFTEEELTPPADASAAASAADPATGDVPPSTPDKSQG